MPILMKCSRCSQSVTADDSMVGQTVACPACEQPLRLPLATQLHVPSWQGKAFPFIASAAGIFLLWAVIATLIAKSNDTSLHQVRSNIDKFEKEAHAARSEAQHLQKEAQGFALLQEENMNKMYPSLRKYKPGRNEVGHQYLEAFEVERNRIKTFMRNRTSTSARPNFEVLFLTKYGFVTDSFNKSWLLDSMAPGQSRIDDDIGVHWRFGAPVYYTITYNN
jgi:hypothetical protein